MITKINWHLPIYIANEANSREHWAAKSRRHKQQKFLIRMHFLMENPKIKLPCIVILTRIAPRFLDEHDNLATSFKWVVDTIAEELTGIHKPGQADRDSRIKWTYRQQKGNVREYALKIEFIENEEG